MDALLLALDAHIAHLTALRDGLRRTRTTRDLPMALHAALGAHLQRKAHALDADALDGQMALVALALRVGDR